MSALVPKVTRELTKMKRTLRNVFGLDKLRPGQAEVIRSVLEGKNTLAIMPTGAGKSDILTVYQTLETIGDTNPSNLRLSRNIPTLSKIKRYA